MLPFDFSRAETVTTAVALAERHQNSRYLGGGTNLVDLMRENIERPASVIDVTGLSETVAVNNNGSVLIGAAAKNTAVAEHDAIRQQFPLLSRAILSGASAQIRNMATVGGNLMQRTRCYYFYDTDASCNKRTPGAGCDAVGGFNRIHAILGASPQCVATHPSDMCVALAALDAIVHVAGPAGERGIPIGDFHRLPGDRPDIETALQPSELITGVEIPPVPQAARTTYRKIRDRASYAFALVSVAAVLEADDGQVKSVRIALGGVAQKPWRATKAEAMLLGGPSNEAAFEAAAAAELADAKPLSQNGFKIALAQRAITSVLVELAQ